MKRLLLTTLAASCLAGGMMPDEARTKPREAKAPGESYEKAKAICDQVALDIAHQVTQKAMADTNVYRAYDECMAKHGFPKAP